MILDYLFDVFEKHKDDDFIVWRGRTTKYLELIERLDTWRAALDDAALPSGAVVAIEADYSPNAVAFFLALVEHQSILVPLSAAVHAQRSEFLEVAQVEYSCSIGGDDQVQIDNLGGSADHALYSQLRSSGHPGLVVFSSASTGKTKAAVHDVVPLLDKFMVRRHQLRIIPFLLYDHLGGVNTMLYALSNGGCLVAVDARTPDQVLAAVEEHGVQLLPTSPTFLNLILLSEAHTRYNLSSLKIISYGTEPMPESTLKRCRAAFPEVRLEQTYGLSELGVLRSKSKSSDSLWVRVGGEGFETRVVDGILHIRAHSAMLGYLNAPSPFTHDGWFVTGDVVEVDGEYVRFLGRESEVINVGGQKVFPAEVESVIQGMPNVAEVTVFGEENLIIGQIVCARMLLREPQDPTELTRQVKQHCAKHLQPYKIPMRVRADDSVQHSERFKKLRRSTARA